MNYSKVQNDENTFLNQDDSIATDSKKKRKKHKESKKDKKRKNSS